MFSTAATSGAFHWKMFSLWLNYVFIRWKSLLRIMYPSAPALHSTSSKKVSIFDFYEKHRVGYWVMMLLFIPLRCSKFNLIKFKVFLEAQLKEEKKVHQSMNFYFRLHQPTDRLIRKLGRRQTPKRDFFLLIYLFYQLYCFMSQSPRQSCSIVCQLRWNRLEIISREKENDEAKMELSG